jgi:ribonucleotide reductase beta subunit family protein with ferritin-like domain
MIPQHLIPVKGKYGEAPIDFANKQLQILWFPDEIKVEKDIQDILVNMTESERHGVITVLKLFTLYELFAGDEYWGTRFKEIFDDADMHRMAAVNAMIELAVHAPFYKKLNEALHIDNEDFYISYVNDPVLADRMKFIGEVISSDNDLFSLASFSMVEGAILYSSFAFLKHFQARGKNKLLNVVRGINFSVRDENCLDKETEVLTPLGWKKITEVSLSDEVLQYDTKTGETSFVHPSNLVTTISDTSLVFESNNYHQRVTPNHRMILKDGEVLAKNASGKEVFIAGKFNAGSFEKGYTDGIEISTQFHEPETFYCLTVPGSAFVIKSNEKISVTGNCHSLGGAWAFKVRKQELNLTPEQDQELKETIFAAAQRLYEHECRIAQMIFEKGGIDGITETQLTHFVQSRINECLKELGYEKLFDVKYNPIADWFYDGINGFAFNDFFSGMGNSYHRKWDENDFVW